MAVPFFWIKKNKRKNRGFTVVELMVILCIMGVLGSVFLGWSGIDTTYDYYLEQCLVNGELPLADCKDIALALSRK